MPRSQTATRLAPLALPPHRRPRARTRAPWRPQIQLCAASFYVVYAIRYSETLRSLRARVWQAPRTPVYFSLGSRKCYRFLRYRNCNPTNTQTHTAIQLTRTRSRSHFPGSTRNLWGKVPLINATKVGQSDKVGSRYMCRGIRYLDGGREREKEGRKGEGLISPIL